MNSPSQMRVRGRSRVEHRRARVLARVLVISCSVALAVAAAAPSFAAAVSPPLSPGSGGSQSVTGEGSQPQLHIFGNTSPPSATQTAPNGSAGPDLQTCYAWGEMIGGPTVDGFAEGRCSEAKEQEIEVCLEQKYEGAWHSSETCKVAGPADVQFLPDYTARALECTSGRYYRVWDWYYTPGGSPEITTALIPTAGGETRC